MVVHSKQEKWSAVTFRLPVVRRQSSSKCGSTPRSVLFGRRREMQHIVGFLEPSFVDVWWNQNCKDICLSERHFFQMIRRVLSVFCSDLQTVQLFGWNTCG